MHGALTRAVILSSEYKNALCAHAILKNVIARLHYFSKIILKLLTFADIYQQIIADTIYRPALIPVSADIGISANR